MAQKHHRHFDRGYLVTDRIDFACGQFDKMHSYPKTFLFKNQHDLHRNNIVLEERVYDFLNLSCKCML